MDESKVTNLLHTLKSNVKDNLRKHGIVPPIKTKRGIKIDQYEIVKNQDGWTIFNQWGEAEHQFLNYLQTAILVANNLALRKYENKQVLEDDRAAGSSEFDTKLFEYRYKKSVKNNDDFGVNLYSIRLVEAKNKHKKHFYTISSAYIRMLNKIKMLEKSNKYS
jgi:hypothetical protein